MEIRDIKFDCRYFRGEIPCLPNKLRNKVCPACDEYSPVTKRILIIKLGALGDVIRTTPLVAYYRKKFPGCHITWLTHSPEILPKDTIDSVRKFDFESVYTVTHQEFDIAVNLDKEIEACSLLCDVKAKEKFGFVWKENHIDIATPAAKHKLITGLFDNISKENKKSYPEEIFEICGLKFSREEYLLPVNEKLAEKWKSLRKKAGKQKIIGLSTGCGKRWLTRLWPDEHWIQLIKKLRKEKMFPLLLGGGDEDKKNKSFSRKTKAYYPGTFSLEEFIALCSNCDGIVSAVSMSMHIAIGLKKPLILFNNIFNRHEFELYGRGEIIEPSTGCDCFYGSACTRERHCMRDISAQEVCKAIRKYI
jgi:heptosyltransferase-2